VDLTIFEKQTRYNAARGEHGGSWVREIKANLVKKKKNSGHFTPGKFPRSLTGEGEKKK